MTSREESRVIVASVDLHARLIIGVQLVRALVAARADNQPVGDSVKRLADWKATTQAELERRHIPLLHDGVK